MIVVIGFGLLVVYPSRSCSTYVAPLRIRRCRASRLVAVLLLFPLVVGKVVWVACVMVLRLVISLCITLSVVGMLMALGIAVSPVKL